MWILLPCAVILVATLYAVTWILLGVIQLILFVLSWLLSDAHEAEISAHATAPVVARAIRRREVLRQRRLAGRMRRDNQRILRSLKTEYGPIKFWLLTSPLGKCLYLVFELRIVLYCLLLSNER